MTDERLPDGPDRDDLIQLIRDRFPDAVVAQLEDAAFFSVDESNWPNFATVVWSDRHDVGNPSNLAREGVYRVNIGVDKKAWQALFPAPAHADATTDFAAFDRVMPHPVYAKQRWIGILNPSHETVRDIVMPLVSAGYDRLAATKTGQPYRKERHR